jgi:hypothetical protein
MMCMISLVGVEMVGPEVAIVGTILVVNYESMIYLVKLH